MKEKIKKIWEYIKWSLKGAIFIIFVTYMINTCEQNSIIVYLFTVWLFLITFCKTLNPLSILSELVLKSTSRDSKIMLLYTLSLVAMCILRYTSMFSSNPELLDSVLQVLTDAVVSGLAILQLKTMCTSKSDMQSLDKDSNTLCEQSKQHELTKV